MSTEVDDFLEHFGVKGMKWGHHKSQEHRQAVKVARKEAYAKSIDAYKAHKLRNTGASAAAGVLAMKFGPGMGGPLVGGLTAASVATIPMIRAQGYSKGKSVALGLIGGPVSLVVVSEISARKNAKA